MGKVNWHADNFQVRSARFELVKLQGILLGNAGPPGLRRCGEYPVDMGSCESHAVGREATEGDTANAKEGEKEEAFVLFAVVAAHARL